MSHYAKIEDSIVTTVIVAEQDFVDAQAGTWVQTSYNTTKGQHTLGGTPMRKNYAGIGMVYDGIRDAFYAPRPYPSWTLNEATCIWEPPVVYPADGSFEKRYSWNEGATRWVEVT